MLRATFNFYQSYLVLGSVTLPEQAVHVTSHTSYTRP